MKLTEDCINHNAVRIIKSLVESRYEFIDNNQEMERGFLLMTIGEIAGVVEMAEAMKEVLNV